MNDVTEYSKSYREYKAELDGELQKTAESFVRIGYLLKVARDTNILDESGYKNVSEFAKAEYSLDRTQVSRFISINDRFAEGGYSDRLQEGYRGYGYAKLTIMLQLPEAVNEELTPDYSKAEIDTIRQEIVKEQQVSDMELYIEEAQQERAPVDERREDMCLVIEQLGEDDPELYIAVSKNRIKETDVELSEIMAPSGDKMYMVRVKGRGRMMLSISDVSDVVRLINTRTGERKEYSWEDVLAAWIYAGVLADKEDPCRSWETHYGRRCPVAEQQEEKKADKAAEAPKKIKKKEKPKAEKKKETKIQLPPKEWASVYNVGQQVKNFESLQIGTLRMKDDRIGKWDVTTKNGLENWDEASFEAYTEPETIETIEEPEVVVINTEEGDHDTDTGTAGETEAVDSGLESEKEYGAAGSAEGGAAGPEETEGSVEETEAFAVGCMNPPEQEVVEKAFGNRKKYIDSLTEFGTAEYICREWKEGRLNSTVMNDIGALARWAEGMVDAHGWPWEE